MPWLIPETSFRKTIQKKGQGLVFPQEFSACDVALLTVTEVSEYWKHSDNYKLNSENVNIILGTGLTPLNLAVERCVLTMQPGETSSLLIRADGSDFPESNDILHGDANQENNNGATIPKKARGVDHMNQHEPQICKITVTLNGIVQQSSSIFDLSPIEVLDRSKTLKEHGVKMFGQKHTTFAYQYFVRALKYIICLDRQEDIASEVKEELGRLKVQCYLNVGLVKLQNSENEAVITSCSRALEIDRNNVKGLYRRGQAYANTNELDRAEVDLSHALSLEPGNNVVEKLLDLVKERKRIQEQKLAKAMSKMFSS